MFFFVLSPITLPDYTCVYYSFLILLYFLWYYILSKNIFDADIEITFIRTICLFYYLHQTCLTFSV